VERVEEDAVLRRLPERVLDHEMDRHPHPDEREINPARDLDVDDREADRDPDPPP
jgi:hypothetical protein